MDLLIHMLSENIKMAKVLTFKKSQSKEGEIPVIT
jgi:hypothetical protein